MNKLNWAVLGTGVVANQMAQAMQDVGRKLYAVGNRTHSKAVDFANKYGIEKVYEDLNDMFYDDNVDVIYKIGRSTRLNSSHPSSSRMPSSA